MNLKDLYKPKSFGSLKSKIGTLILFGVSMKDQTELASEFLSNLGNLESKEFIRQMIRVSSFPAASLNDEHHKPDLPVLTKAELDKLDDDDLENFSRLYVESHQSLFRKSEFKKETREGGKVVSTPVLGEIEHKRQDDESHVEYLARLSVLQRNEHRERMEKLFEPYKSFSKDLLYGIRENLFHGDALKTAMGSMRTDHSSYPTINQPEIETPDFGESFRLSEEIRQRPFNELSDRLDQLVDSSIQASEFAIESNTIQTQIAAEIKNSGDSSSRYSKDNINISLAIILLTVTGLGVAAYTSYSTTKQAGEIAGLGEKALISLTDGLNDISGTINRDRIGSNDLLQSQIEQLQVLITTQRESNQLIQLLENEILRLRGTNSILNREIESLSERLELVENLDN